MENTKTLKLQINKLAAFDYTLNNEHIHVQLCKVMQNAFPGLEDINTSFYVQELTVNQKIKFTSKFSNKNFVLKIVKIN